MGEKISHLFQNVATGTAVATKAGQVAIWPPTLSQCYFACKIMNKETCCETVFVS